MPSLPIAARHGPNVDPIAASRVRKPMAKSIQPAGVAETAAPSSRPTKPAEFPDILAWAAWLYFVDEMTQSEVAKAIGVSRVTVIKLLSDAKKSGLVSVRINPTLASRVSVSRDLAARFGLNSVTLIPDNQDAPLVERLGKVGAFALVEGLKPADVIGVAWGRTVLAVARNLLLETPVPDLTVVQVAPSPNGLSAAFSPELCASLCANNLQARSVNLLAPAIVSSAELRAMLLQEPSIRNQLDIIRSANKVLFGVGALDRAATIRASELHGDNVIDQMVRDGAAASILGRFLAPDGRELISPAHDRMMGISLAEFVAIPTRLCVAGGAEKRAAISATLRGGYATDLVTDLPTAQALLADEPG
ncbi:MAG: sugar-binding transcriptional regulator [Pseudomonadota bacterium]